MDNKKLRYIDLFAGIGGFRRAFDAVGAQCVMTCEIDRFARQSYAANFDCTHHHFPEDITALDASDIAPFDVLVGGFPCQAFSLAGKKLGFSEARGTLFFDIARILKERQPKAFLLENVKNLASHDKGRTFSVIKSALTELGYDFDWRVISSRGFVPQDRQRVFIMGFRKDLGISASQAMKEVDAIVSALPDRHVKEILEPSPDAKYVLSPKLWDYLQAHANKHAARGNGFGFGLVKPWEKTALTRTISARYGKDGSEILIARKGGARPRRLTPREAARIQGFPDDHKIVVSDTQAYKQFGNAVAVPVVQMLAKVLTANLAKAKK